MCCRHRFLDTSTAVVDSPDQEGFKSIGGMLDQNRLPFNDVCSPLFTEAKKTQF